MTLHNSDVLSQGMREYGDGTQTVRQTTRGKLITLIQNSERNFKYVKHTK